MGQTNLPALFWEGSVFVSGLTGGAGATAALAHRQGD